MLQTFSAVLFALLTAIPGTGVPGHPNSGPTLDASAIVFPDGETVQVVGPAMVLVRDQTGRRQCYVYPSREQGPLSPATQFDNTSAHKCIFKAAGACCVTCKDRTICATSVVTSCGSCDGGGGGRIVY